MKHAFHINSFRLSTIMHNALCFLVYTLVMAKLIRIRKNEVSDERQKTRLSRKKIIHTEELTPEQLCKVLAEGFDPIAVSVPADDIPS